MTNLSKIKYDDPAYTIIFIAVGHNGETFSFLNQLNNRWEFFWHRWGEWKQVLTPLTTHAFLVEAYNTKGGSGQGFKPVQHLCKFIGIDEARVYNAAYLTQYLKVYHDGTRDEVTELSLDFAEKLITVAEERDHWLQLVESNATKAFNAEIAEMFGAPYDITSVPAYELAYYIDTGESIEDFKRWVEIHGEECPEQFRVGD